MWLVTKHGFYSIVQKQPGEFHVRARVRQDLQNLVERVPLERTRIRDTRSADYPFRFIVGKDEVMAVLEFLGETLDYPGSQFTSSAQDQLICTSCPLSATNRVTEAVAERLSTIGR